MKLTRRALSSLPPGAALPDPSVPGLRYLRARNGRLYAQLRYRTGAGWRAAGIGPVDLDELRDTYARAYLAEVEADVDEHPAPVSFSITLDDILSPIRSKAREERRRLLSGETKEGGITFAAVADEFMARHVAQLARRSQPEYRRHIEQIFKPRWGRKPLAALSRKEIVAALDAVTDERGPIAANRALATLQSLLTWAVNRHIIEVSPALNMKSPNEERERDRTLSDSELAQLWAAFEALGYPYGDWAMLLTLTACRRSEAATMRWGDIEGLDGDAPTWTLRQKGGRLHLVPLAPMAGSLLRSLPRRGEYVFTTGTTVGGAPAKSPPPISGFADIKTRIDKLAAGVAPWRIHDLRRTARTGLSRLRVQPHVAELVLGHAVTGLIKIYDKHDYLDEKRDALSRWEAHLAAILAGGNVVPMPAARGAA
jgi:integrase